MVAGGFVFMFFQLYLVNHLILFNTAIPFIYFLFLFMMPVSIPAPVEFTIGFAMGLLVDIAGVSLGINASAIIFALGVKRLIIPFTISTGVRDTGDLSLNSQNFFWYFTYLLILIFVYNTVYFLLEAFSFANFGYTLLKIFASTVYSFFINYLICVTFYKK